MAGGRPFLLDGDDVHVWTVRTGTVEHAVPNFERILTADEKDRAGRFHFDRHRQAFTITRGILRCLLGEYAGLDPAAIRFNYGPNGKPALAADSPVEFNVTHSGDLAAFAFTAGCRIGVDVEYMRPFSEIQHLTGRYFCAEEAADIESLPPAERNDAFFRCWTRKEAYIKATGEGLSAPLQGFRVALLPGEPARLLHVAQSANAASTWTMHDLRLAADYAGAVAYPAPERALSVFPISDPASLIKVSGAMRGV